MPKAAIGTFIVAANGERALAQAVTNIRRGEFFVSGRGQGQRMTFSFDLLAQSGNGFELAFLQQVGAGIDDFVEIFVVIDDKALWGGETWEAEEEQK